MVSSQFVVRVDLIQSILVSKEFILSKTKIILLCVELISLFGRKVLTPAPGVIPVVALEQILDFFVDDKSVGVGSLVVFELLQVATLVPWMKLADFEVGLSHLLLLPRNIKNATRSWLRSGPESLLRGRHDLLGVWQSR